jgi:outer membrane protein
MQVMGMRNVGKAVQWLLAGVLLTGSVWKELVAETLLPPQPLDLQTAWDWARSAHPDGAMARSRLAVAEAEAAQARAHQLPRLDLQASYLQTTNPMQGFGAILSQGTFDNSLNFNDPGQLDALTGALLARWRLYSGGARKAGIEAGRAGTRVQESQLTAALDTLGLEVIRTWFAIEKTENALASLKTSIGVLEENLRVSKVREEAGELMRTERLNIEVKLADVRREALAVEQQATLARYRLAFLMGLEPTTPLQLDLADSSAQRIHVPADTSIDNRPELQAAMASLQAAQQQLVAAKAGRLPTIDAHAAIQADRGWRREGNGESWTAGVVVNLPLFDGRSTRNAVASAKARLREAELAMERLRLALSLEAEEARLHHELALAQMEVAQQQVAQAREAAELSRERFAAGTLLSTELIGVESRLVDSEVQLAIASASERIALAEWCRVVGTPVF